MAKCPKCDSRKGKRYCPALDADICTLCCGEHRLKSISCPSDCPHLEGVAYQKRRRWELACSRGKKFWTRNQELFPSEEVLEFATALQSDIYIFHKEAGPLDNAGVEKALRDLKGLFSTIYVPEGPPHPLALFLRERLGRGDCYPRNPSLTDKKRLDVIDRLIRHFPALERKNRNYLEEIEAFYGQLDPTEDLFFTESDLKELRSKFESGETRSPGGVILPFSD